MRRWLGFTAIFCLPVIAGGQAPEKRVGVVARVLTQPLMSPEAVASAEAALAANPADLSARMRLLTQYRESYDAASPLLYVFRSVGSYADAADHEMVRGLWMRQAAANPADARIVINTARFLLVENKPEAEQLLRRALDSAPANPRLAANLGFLYAMQILSLDSFSGDVTIAVPAAEREEARRRSASELENSSNALVLAGAATAIQNLSMRASGGRPVDPELFQLSSRLMAKARGMASSVEALRGPCR